MARRSQAATAEVEAEETKQEKAAKKKQRDAEAAGLLSAVLSGKTDKTQERVAAILNRNQAARDSDLTLAFEYWEEFDGYDGGAIYQEDLRKWTGFKSLARHRAMIQNTFNLFHASPEVQKFRGTLEDEERLHAQETRPSAPTLAIFADESGKTDTNIIVASVWFLEGAATFTVSRRLGEWMRAHGVTGEFHFKNVSAHDLPTYKAFVDFVAEPENLSFVSFRALSVPRAGTGHIQDALAKLYYHLLVRGVETEHGSGRAPLPRWIQFWKDEEEAGSDRLMLAGLEDQMKQAGHSLFDSKLFVDEFRAVPSKVPLIQVADLFASSLNRVFNHPGDGPKDELADHVLTRFNARHILTNTEQVGDMTAHITL